MKPLSGKPKLSTREIILHALKSNSDQKVEELAEAADISPVTVRHHLNALLADGLIEVESVRRKVGRPFYVYRLSEKGMELFPKRYVSFTNRLLGEMKNHLPPEIVNTLLNSVVQKIVDEHRSDFEALPFEGRLDYLVKLLEQEGFLANWEKTEKGYMLTEYSCPYLSIGSQHSEICAFDKELMLNVMQTPIEQHSCMIEGADCCEFSISTAQKEIK